MRTVVGLFDNLSEAKETIRELEGFGLSADMISIASSLGAQPEIEAGTDLRLSPAFADDVGKIAAGGPLAEALRSATGTANMTSILKGAGLSQDVASRYAAGVLRGDTLESVVVEDKDAEDVAELMRMHSHVQKRAFEPTKLAAPAAAIVGEEAATYEDELPRAREAHHFGEDEERRIPIVREELQIGKREIQTGAVRVNVRTAEKPVSGEINLREEHVEIERHPVDRVLRGDEDCFKDRSIEMSEYAEEPLVSKQARVVEEVILHKSVREHVEAVKDTIRETAVDLERPFDSAAYRRHFDELGLRDANFDEYTPAYRFGHELRTDQALTGKRWEDVETSARERWETKSPGTWTRFKEAINYAWART